jgi:hypothetical protein
VGIHDAEITRLVAEVTEYTTINEDITEVTTTTEEPDIVTTNRYPLRIHRPKSPKSHPYPPTARDDYLHLESLKHRTTTQAPIIEDTTITTEDEDNNSISKDVFGALRREEYFKNWVARKYRKPEDAKAKYSIDVIDSTTTSTTETTTEAVTESNVLFPFAPTVLPKGKYTDTFADYTRRKKKISFLEKLKNTARNSLFKKDPEEVADIKLKPRPITTTTTTTTTTTKKPILYPRGSKLNLFKQWGNSQLSQAEFEKTVLGVSTATEVTVQSRICVRGHCFNADDKAAASSFSNNNQF